MTKATSTTWLALVGPGRPPARPVRGLSRGRLRRFSIDAYLAASRAPHRVVLCPTGESLAGDLAFLRRARERLLLSAPPRDIAEAIGGLLTGEPPVLGRPSARGRGPLHRALLLEGIVTERRARSALASPARLWVVESPRSLRLSAATLLRLKRSRVHWAALRPAVVVGVVASPELAAALAASRRGLPASAVIWRAGGRPTPRARPRRPSPR
jgi:hypothetical protein